MTDNPWDGGEAARPGPPEAGLPNVMDLVNACVGEVGKDFGAWLIAGLPPALVAMGAGVGGVFAIYGGMALGAAPGIVAEDEGLMLAGMFGGFGLGLVGLILVVALVLAPMTASMWRSVWRYLAEGERLTIRASWAYAFDDLPRVLLFNFVMMSIVLVGTLMCYLPGLIAGVALSFAYPAVVVQGMPIGRAMSMSVRHAQDHPAWHLGLFAVLFVMGMVLPYVPLIGYALMFTLYPLFVLSAYKAVFGTERSAVP